MPGTVLIVEDSQGTAIPLEIALGLLKGVQVVILSSATAALDLLAMKNDVAALVTDLHMPNIDGYELIRRVRQDARYLKLPIIVITGDSNPDTPGRLSSIGANAIFAKPYSPYEIRRRLEVLLDAS
ncbi:MAG TPA: response regulator [Bryobacteraceae bacterium]|jgi:CheY-like chemotaxis protein|nr:response regulator [Bryobacteraceae bacterium]